MRRYITLSLVLLIATWGVAQTQQGYVKTKGRMVNGKLVPGHGIKGATAYIKGRTATIQVGFGKEKRLPIGRPGRMPKDLQILRQPSLHHHGDARATTAG